MVLFVLGFSGGSDGNESACKTGDLGWEIPWRREWLPTPVSLPGEFHVQRSWSGYSPWICKEVDMTTRLIHARVQLQQPGIQPEGVSGVGERETEAASQFSWTACLFQAYDSLLYFYKSIRSEV